MICYKSALVEQPAAQIRRDPKLSILLFSFHDNFPTKTIITESWRPAMHDGDLHSLVPYRAIDLRSWVFSNPEGAAQIMNNLWLYDFRRPDRMCCVYHDSGSGPHFHLQVHPHTQKRADYAKIMANNRTFNNGNGWLHNNRP